MKHNFTLVEVLIAMGVCVVGVCSIMALFPVGLANTRDTAMAGFSSSTADQMLHLIKGCIVNEDNDEDKASTNFMALSGFTSIDSITENMGRDKPNVNEPEVESSDWVLIDSSTPGFGQLLNSFIVSEDTKIYQCGTAGLYKMSRGENDYDSIVRLWAKPIKVTMPTSKSGTAEFCLPRSARFHMEVSWPANKSYAKRQKMEYTLDVYCPKREAASTTP